MLEQKVVFIAGLDGSGATLLMSALVRHPDVRPLSTDAAGNARPAS